ncbi:hypothetical protein FRB95_014198 [Tulasnella sp. JGI-2019a]|nr:hypothetical protein FRB95_014198 [Tulasnella sp. JGI-2019a]
MATTAPFRLRVNRVIPARVVELFRTLPQVTEKFVNQLMSERKQISSVSLRAQSEADSITQAADDIAMMIQQAREEGTSKSQVLIQRAQWEAAQLRAEGVRTKEKLNKEIEVLKAQLAAAKSAQLPAK